MMIKASGRAALILATGLFVCFAGPSQAATGADGATSQKSATSKSAAASKKSIKYGSRHWKKVALRKSGKMARKSAARKPVELADDEADTPATLPASVANANAQLASADMPAGNAKAMTARANNNLQATPDNATPSAASSQIVAADQLNDLDRALQENKPLKMAAASTDVPAATVAPPVIARSDDSSTWDQTSLIGKIFIAFGALLTMASAARMFMA